MSSRVLTAWADWTVEQFAAFLTEHEISGAPVLSEDGALIGVASLSDIARHESTEASDEDATPAYYRSASGHLTPPEAALDKLATRPETTVRDIMMPTLFCVDEDTPAPEIADKMIRSQLHRLLVVRPGSRRDVVGIVTSMDLMQVVRDMTDA